MDKLALALRDLRGSPDTEDTRWIDAQEADTLRAALRQHGLALVPTEVTEPIRRAVWLAQYEHAASTLYPGLSGDALAEMTDKRLADEDQAERDRIAWRAGIAAGEQEVRGDG